MRLAKASSCCALRYKNEGSGLRLNGVLFKPKKALYIRNKRRPHSSVTCARAYLSAILGNKVIEPCAKSSMKHHTASRCRGKPPNCLTGKGLADFCANWTRGVE